MEPQRRKLTDPDSLKALAHPTRMALLGALVTEGPLTASQAAELVGESPSNCSWHLRKLAEHGFVTEAEGGTGRNRPWEATSEGLEWSDDDDTDPAARMAADALTDVMLDREVQRFRASRAAAADEEPAWKHVGTVSQSQLWLTPDEARGLAEEMTALFTRHLDRHHDPSLRPEGARLVSLVGWLVPNTSHRVDLAPQRHSPTAAPSSSDSADPTQGELS